MMDGAHFHIEGAKELERMFERLPIGLRSRAVDTVMRRATKPVVKAARAILKRRGHVHTGNLIKSIGVVLRRYRRGTLRYAAIGGRYPKGKHFHLLERGTKDRYAITLKHGYWHAVGQLLSDKNLFRGKMDVEALGGPFLLPAFHTNKRKMLEIIKKDSGQIIEKLAKKYL